MNKYRYKVVDFFYTPCDIDELKSRIDNANLDGPQQAVVWQAIMETQNMLFQHFNSQLESIAIDLLNEEWTVWCHYAGYEPQSADDLLVELSLTKDASDQDKEYIQDFINRWEAATNSNTNEEEL